MVILVSKREMQEPLITVPETVQLNQELDFIVNTVSYIPTVVSVVLKNSMNMTVKSVNGLGTKLNELTINTFGLLAGIYTLVITVIIGLKVFILERVIEIIT